MNRVVEQRRGDIEDLCARFKVKRLELFGSAARADFDAETSDLDFLVVVEESPLDAYERDAVAYRALGDIRLPIDVQVYTRTEFEKRAALPVSFERTVKTKGRIVYAA